MAVLALSFAATIAQAQPASPPATTTVTIKGHKITIDYSSPSMRGRKIMGELVPFGKVWRMGANEATKITTDTDITLGTLKLPKGSYSLYCIPTADSWELIVNKQTGQSGMDYEQGQDFGRTKMTVKTMPNAEEKMKIMLTAGNGNKGLLAVAWEKTVAAVPIAVE